MSLSTARRLLKTGKKLEYYNYINLAQPQEPYLDTYNYLLYIKELELSLTGGLSHLIPLSPPPSLLKRRTKLKTDIELI
jgi:hypothetical protein